MRPDVYQGLRGIASRLDIPLVDLLTVINFESNGDPDARNSSGHYGLIQFSPENQQAYGVRLGTPLATQLAATEQYLRRAGIGPGTTLANLYRVINAGPAGSMNAKDNDGTTVSQKVGSKRMQQSMATALADVQAGGAGGAGAPSSLLRVGGDSQNWTPPGPGQSFTPPMIDPKFYAPPPTVQAPPTPEQGGFPDMSVAGGRTATTPPVTLPPGFIRYNITDGTSMQGMDQRTLAGLHALATSLYAAGGTGLEVHAGKGWGGHKSHYTGTEMDVVGYGPGGAIWSPELRLAAAIGARNAGANRFGLYGSGNTLHFGYGNTPMTWGQGNLTETDASRAFTNPNELAFSQAVLSGNPYALPGGATSTVRLPTSYDPNPAMQLPKPRPMGLGMTPGGQDKFGIAPVDLRPVSVGTGQPVATPPAGGAGNGIDWSGMAGAFGGGTGATTGIGGGGGDGSGMSLTPQDSPAPSAQAQQGPPTPPGMTALLPKIDFDFNFDPNTIGSFSRLMAARSQNPYRA